MQAATILLRGSGGSVVGGSRAVGRSHRPASWRKYHHCNGSRSSVCAAAFPGRHKAPIQNDTRRENNPLDSKSILLTNCRARWLHSTHTQHTIQNGPVCKAADTSRTTTVPTSNTIPSPLDLRIPQETKTYSTKEILTATAELSKLKLSALVVATTSAGFLAAGGPISWSTLFSCCAGTALCSSSAATFNQVFEKGADAKMKRTRNRPFPKNMVSPWTAVALGTTTGISGVTVLACGTDAVTACLGASNIILYAGVYTYLKPRSEWNTWVGAVVGAIPPVMGWTAAGGSPLDVEALLLGGTLYLWQFPHFMALSWMHRVDYARGGFAMVPCHDDEHGSRTAKFIKEYALYLSVMPIASCAVGVTSWMFAFEGVVLNAYALHVARVFDQERSNGNARKVFLTSLWYLPCWMMLFILHSKTWEEENDAKVKDGDLRLVLKDAIQAVKRKGRELCIHERACEEEEEEEKCPIVLGKNKAKVAAESSVYEGVKAAEAIGDVAGTLPKSNGGV